MAGPQDLIAQMMAAQQGGGQGMPMPPQPGGGMPMPQGGPSDEAMLDQVSSEMGGGSPPPTGGMKWVDMQADQQALMDNPTPENVQAFAQYWGEENLPKGMNAGGGSGNEPEDQGGDDTEAGE